MAAEDRSSSLPDERVITLQKLTLWKSALARNQRRNRPGSARAPGTRRRAWASGKLAAGLFSGSPHPPRAGARGVGQPAELQGKGLRDKAP